MKGNVLAPRNSLFDVFQYNSWIKKSNYEGIFNAILFIFIWTIIHKPIVRVYTLNRVKMNYIRMGRPFDPELINMILD